MITKDDRNQYWRLLISIRKAGLGKRDFNLIRSCLMYIEKNLEGITKWQLWQWPWMMMKIYDVLKLYPFRNRLFNRIMIPLYQIIINYSCMLNLNRLKLVLVEKNKTGRWFADELGKTPCTVSEWCSYTIQPDLKTLGKTANLLNVDLKDLLNSTKQYTWSTDEYELFDYFSEALSMKNWRGRDWQT